MSKITVSYNGIPLHIFFLKISKIWDIILHDGFQNYRNRQNMFNVCIKVTNIASIDVILMILISGYIFG